LGAIISENSSSENGSSGHRFEHPSFEHRSFEHRSFEHRVADSRKWLRNALDAEELDLLGVAADRQLERRTIRLSELEALALLFLAFDARSVEGTDVYTQDIARHLSAVLLTRLESGI
jgi:hypothetical protein